MSLIASVTDVSELAELVSKAAWYARQCTSKLI